MAKEKEIVIPVSKVKTRKKTNAEKKESLEEMVDKVEENPWDVNKIDHSNDIGVKVDADGKILVSFTKFVQLLATHDFVDLVEKYENEDIHISSDLLVELAASPTEEVQESRFSWVFLGVVLGAIAAAIIFMFFVN